MEPDCHASPRCKPTSLLLLLRSSPESCSDITTLRPHSWSSAFLTRISQSALYVCLLTPLPVGVAKGFLRPAQSPAGCRRVTHTCTQEEPHTWVTWRGQGSPWPRPRPCWVVHQAAAHTARRSSRSRDPGERGQLCPAYPNSLAHGEQVVQPWSGESVPTCPGWMQTQSSPPRLGQVRPAA